MAIVVEEKEVLVKGNVSGRVRVSGLATLSGGDAAFPIRPGNNTTNITGPINSIGLRRIDCWGVTCEAEDATAPKVEKLYTTTYDQDYLAVDGVANESYVWWVEGEYVGA